MKQVFKRIEPYGFFGIELVACEFNDCFRDATLETLMHPGMPATALNTATLPLTSSTVKAALKSYKKEFRLDSFWQPLQTKAFLMPTGGGGEDKKC